MYLNYLHLSFFFIYLFFFAIFLINQIPCTSFDYNFKKKNCFKITRHLTAFVLLELSLTKNALKVILNKSLFPPKKGKVIIK